MRAKLQRKFHSLQFDYPQLLSCHEAVGIPSAKKWNLKQWAIKELSHYDRNYNCQVAFLDIFLMFEGQ